MSLNGLTGKYAAVPWAVGCFPDGSSVLMLVCARLRHVAGTQWGNKKCMNVKHLETIPENASVAD